MQSNKYFSPHNSYLVTNYYPYLIGNSLLHSCGGSKWAEKMPQFFSAVLFCFHIAIFNYSLLFYLRHFSPVLQRKTTKTHQASKPPIIHTHTERERKRQRNMMEKKGWRWFRAFIKGLVFYSLPLFWMWNNFIST